MANFKTAYQKTSKIEGGYANNPRDKGGETYKGISRKIHPEWKGWALIDAIKNKVGTAAPSINQAGEKNIELQAMVMNFYEEIFWDSLNLSLINDQRMAGELYDTGVNLGTGRAGQFLQTVLNVATKTNLTVDGKIGPKTISVFNALSVDDKYMVWKLFNCLQGEKYISICEADPSQEIFLRSWASRVFEQ